MPKIVPPPAPANARAAKPDTVRSAKPDPRSAALCLGGGNALGAYQAGYCEALLDAGFAFPVIAGTSVGGIIGALIAGNAPAKRPAALRAFWQALHKAEMPWQPWGGLGARRLTMLRTLLTGHSRLFQPKVPGLLSALAGVDTGRALYGRQPMRDLLLDLVDFDLLNRAPPRLILPATDAETGELVTFETGRDTLTVDHLMAVTAFPLLFEPVRIGERWLIDAALRCNLPLDLIPQDPDLPCIAVDLFPLADRLPDTLTAMAARAQDITLAGQSADAIARYAAREGAGRLVHAVYSNPKDQTATKTLDFSARMLDQRHAAGMADAARLLENWENGSMALSA
jgi:NTE family protein